MLTRRWLRLRRADATSGAAGKDVGAAAAAAAGAAGAGARPAGVFLHFRLRHRRGLRRRRLLPDQLLRPIKRHRHRPLRLSLPVERGHVLALADRVVQRDVAPGPAPGGRLLVLGAVLRGRGRPGLLGQHGRPGALPGLPAPVPRRRRAPAPAGLGGHRGAVVPVAGELLSLGQGSGGRQDLDGRVPARVSPAQRHLLPGRGHPHGVPQRVRDLRLPQPAALGRQLLVRLQRDRVPPPGPARRHAHRLTPPTRHAHRHMTPPPAPSPPPCPPPRLESFPREMPPNL